MPFAVVDWDLILEVIVVSLVAGTGSVTIFSVVVFASSRAAEARREGDNPAGYGLLAAGGMVAFMALVVFAIVLITNKG